MKALLPIRQRLNALACLKSGQKLVLIEVCELAENGSKQEVNASNGYLAGRLGISERTVSRTLVELASAGLVVVREPQGKGRLMLPATQVREVYWSTEPSQVAADNLANLARFNLDKPGKQPRQTRSDNLDKPGKQPRQTRSRVIGDDQDDQFNDQDDQREGAQKYELGAELIATPLASAGDASHTEGGAAGAAALEAELAEANAALATCRATIAELRAQLAQAQNKIRATSLAGAAPNALPYASEAFSASWRDYRAAQGVAPHSARERALLSQLATLATDEQQALAIVNQSIRKGWKDLYHLDQPRATTPTTSTHAAQHPTSYPPRPINGHKPAGDGGSLARLLAESD